MTAVHYYLDEHLSPVIAEQLRQRGIEVFTTQGLQNLGDSDISHLQRATEMGCVLCTFDTDFLILAQAGTNHAGIVFGRPDKHGIGEWVKGLELLHSLSTAEEMRNRVEFL